MDRGGCSVLLSERVLCSLWSMGSFGDVPRLDDILPCPVLPPISHPSLSIIGGIFSYHRRKSVGLIPPELRPPNQPSTRSFTCPVQKVQAGRLEEEASKPKLSSISLTPI
jgi:hypothetical protein